MMTFFSPLIQLIYPTPSNQYRAYLSRPMFVLVVATFLVLVNISWFTYSKYHSVYGITTDLSESQIIALTNLERTQVGLQGLQPNILLSQAAMAKANNMISTGQFDHYYQVNGETVNPWQFILEAGYNYLHAGENLGRNFYTSQTLVKAWMDSPAHKANLLNDVYTQIGVAVVEGPPKDGRPTTIIVQLLATPVPQELQHTISQSPQVNTPPLLERQDTWLNSFFAQYPLVLFGLTSAVTILVGLSLMIDLTKSRQLRRQHLNQDLWLH